MIFGEAEHSFQSIKLIINLQLLFFSPGQNLISSLMG